jgi:hypothetical protein
MSADYNQEIAGVLEAGKFHMAFFDDRLAMPDRYGNDHAHTVEYGIRCVKMNPVIVLTTHPGCKYRQDRARYRGLRERAERRPRATAQCHDYRSSRRHCRARGAAPLPAVYNIRPFVTAGGLMSYGVDFTDVFRQAASVRGSRVKNDPACVKTHTSAKCRKYNSPTRYRTSCAQHDSTPWCAISSRCFYVRGGRWSFRTAKTLFRHRRVGEGSYFATSPRSSLLFQFAYTIVRRMTRRSSGR